ncbi:centromere protein X isoform X1 [Ailuropoda melanoleuca]|uniref:centromere protein X isoform X1 n=1 Tax=Ailuropoda melanoleuca TaxID=9646 RepID=UPI0014943822|nr:centromere protein X isoform X1 [Ailuropoda melanoleuca]
MEGTGGGFRKDLVSKLLRLHFTDSKTKVSGDALWLMAELLTIFVVAPGLLGPPPLLGPLSKPRPSPTPALLWPLASDKQGAAETSPAPKTQRGSDKGPTPPGVPLCPAADHLDTAGGRAAGGGRCLPLTPTGVERSAGSWGSRC